MEKTKTSMSVWKWLVVFAHIAAMLLAIAGVGKAYHNENYGQGLDWLETTRYEDTPAFAGQLQKDVELIFEYVKYRELLEKDGQLNLDSDMVELTYAPGDDRYYDINDLINYGRAKGMYLLDNYELFEEQKVQEEEEYDVIWKLSSDDIVGTEPGTEKATLYDLSKEVLTILGNYYKVKNIFNEQESNLYYRIVYTEFHGKYVTEFGNIPEEFEGIEGTESADDYLMQLGKHLKVSGESGGVESNLTIPLSNVASMLKGGNMNNNNEYYMVLAVDTNYPKEDEYRASALNYARSRQEFTSGLFMAVVGFFICLVTLFLMFRFTGKKEFGGSVVLGGVDKWATELWLFGWVCISILFLYLIRAYGAKLVHLVMEEQSWKYGERMVFMVAVYLCALVGALSVYRRHQKEQIWANSLLRRLSFQMREYVKHKSESFRMAGMYGAYLLINLLFAAAAFVVSGYVKTVWVFGGLALLAIGWLFFSLWVFHLIFSRAVQEDKISNALSRISGGDTTFKIDADKFSGKPKLLAEEINNISVGLDKAIQEMVKSERLKTDLITNVSHDIKTPLTSIINYVDLIKREKIQDPKIQSYLEVLEQKSQRLKNLTEDLVEASKASSGNLNLEISDIDFVELINQTNGEFEEKFARRNLTLVMRLPEEHAVIQADGRRLWRVLENLYNNAYKYAMTGSRVYVDVMLESGQAVLVLKNVSENPLNIHGDELTERFVRGDVARTTEGSGLGLSIAKSLTQLQKGQFTIDIDGDLFKVKVSFPIKA